MEEEDSKYRRVYLHYLDKALEVRGLKTLKLDGMEKVVFLKEEIYFSKTTDGWNFWGTLNKRLPEKFQRVRSWNKSLETDLYKEISDSKLINGIIPYNL